MLLHDVYPSLTTWSDLTSYYNLSSMRYTNDVQLASLPPFSSLILTLSLFDNNPSSSLNWMRAVVTVGSVKYHQAEHTLASPVVVLPEFVIPLSVFVFYFFLPQRKQFAGSFTVGVLIPFCGVAHQKVVGFSPQAFRCWYE